MPGANAFCRNCPNCPNCTPCPLQPARPDTAAQAAATVKAEECLAALRLINMHHLTKAQKVLVNLANSWCQAVTDNKVPVAPMVGWAVQQGVALTERTITARNGKVLKFVIPTSETSDEGSQGSQGAEASAALYERMIGDVFDVVKSVCLEFQAL